MTRVLVLLLVLQSARVRAEGSPLHEALHAEARAEYDAAFVAFGANDFASAATKFSRAFELSGDARLLWNIAVCEKNARHYARMLALLERYEREAHGQMSAAHRREVSQVMARARKLVGTLRLNVREHGAEVFVDDVSVGHTPLNEPLRLDPGVHKLQIRKLGYRVYSIAQPASAAAEIGLEVELTPRAQVGYIAVSAAPGDAIHLDGAFVGHGAWQGSVASGRHVVRVTAPGKRAFTRELVVTDEQTRALAVSLEAERPRLAPLLWVGAGVLVAGGLATATYFLLRPSSAPAYKQGTWEPGTVAIP
jgi:hypothetical protein